MIDFTRTFRDKFALLRPTHFVVLRSPANAAVSVVRTWFEVGFTHKSPAILSAGVNGDIMGPFLRYPRERELWTSVYFTPK